MNETGSGCRGIDFKVADGAAEALDDAEGLWKLKSEKEKRKMEADTSKTLERLLFIILIH